MAPDWSPAKAGLHVLRAAALLSTAAAVLALGLLVTGHPWLGRLDAWLEARRFDGPHEALAAALAPGNDPAAMRATLTQLHREFAGFRLGDRQERIWALATLFLAKDRLANGDPAAAAALAAQLVRARPRELIFHFLLVEAERALGRDGRADSYLQELLDKLPEHDEVARRCAAAAAAAQDWPRLGRTLAAHLRRPPPLFFEVLYRTPDQDPALAGFQRAHLLPSVAPDGHLRLTFAVPAGAAAVDLQLPPHGHYQLHEVRLAGEFATSLEPPTLTDATATGPPATPTITVAGTKAPTLRWHFAPLTAAQLLHVEAELSSQHAPWLAAILDSPALPDVIAALAADAPADARLLRRHAERRRLDAGREATSTGPEGTATHPLRRRHGWPGLDGALPIAWSASPDRTLSELYVPWPADAASDELPDLTVEPPPPGGCRLERTGEGLRVVLASPAHVDRVVLTGGLLP